MSRFGLRSHTDVTHKEYEDDENTILSTTSTSTSTTTTTGTATTNSVDNKTNKSAKRVYQQKKKKKKKMLENQSANEVETTTTITTPISLMCSLPLTRLSGIIEKLQLTKNAKNQATKYLLQQQQQQQDNSKLFDSLKLSTKKVVEEHTELTDDEEDEEAEEEEEEKRELNDKEYEEKAQEQKELQHYHNHNHNKNKQQQEQQANLTTTTTTTTTVATTGKLMCLYCDKKFNSCKMQAKHVEKFHIQPCDRRSSGRNNSNHNQLDEQIVQQDCDTTTTTTIIGATITTNRRQQQFPGCCYCKKSTNPTTTIDDMTTETNLNALFLHYVECHSDKYYACKLCMLRFPSNSKLHKHKQMLHKTVAASTTTQSCDEDEFDDTDSIATTTTTATSSSLCTINNNNNNIDDELQQQQKQQLSTTTITMTTTKTIATAPITTTKRSLRLLQQQHSLDNSNSTTDTNCSTPIMSNEEPTILSRLGLAQNRLPSKRKGGMRLRRGDNAATTTTTSELQMTPTKLRSGRMAASTTTTTLTPTNTIITTTTTTTTSTSITTTTTTTNINQLNRTTTIANISNNSIQTESPTREVLFRVPTRNELLSSYVIDDDFYKEVVNNVRHNLLYYLDGKIKDNTLPDDEAQQLQLQQQLEQQQLEYNVVRSTVVRSPLILNEEDTELHAASLLSAITAFPTLLTAEQYGADALTKRRTHTKHSWKWKWDSAKKYKLINEGGKIIKKMKPLMGLRDLSKLDMWTQLSMRQKHEQMQLQQQQQQETTNNEARLEKLRLNEQLNLILDRRLLPQISLEQNEQAIVKTENSTHTELAELKSETEITTKNLMSTSFLSMLDLRPTNPAHQNSQSRLVLSGEWARPRCYMCMCCGAKFDKLKSLEEHKMFRHTHIYCTHYEVVGRELLANNLLRHLFLPKQALARYSANNCLERSTNLEHSLLPGHEDESSDSLQSSATTIPRESQTIVSPTHSLQSCSSATSSPVTTPTTPTALLRTPNKLFHSNNNNNNNNNTTNEISSTRICTKCQRKCSGAMDLYRHMLDCSGDYIWSMVKKRKYRYYCGSKKRRPCNKHLRGEFRRTPKQQQQQQQAPKTPENSQQIKAQIQTTPTPRQRPSDGRFLIVYKIRYKK